ncbi:MAG: hypothetical protein J5842_04790 [Lachnospiraceae bacterium]|nr:hypothetical protein [Lachnospiraceae bacterium]
MKNSEVRILLGVIILLLLVIASAAFVRDNNSFSYNEYLDEELFVLSDKEKGGSEPDTVTLRDFGFYIYWVESFTQQQARKYNYKDPSDYWNTHFSAGEDSQYVSVMAKNAAADACIGDMVYARMAHEAGFELTDEDKQSIDDKTDEWMDSISEEQLGILGLDRARVKNMISRQLLAKAYALEYAKTADLTGYKGDVSVLLSGGGDYFEDKLLSRYSLRKNKKIFSALNFGRITVNRE